LPRVLTSMWHIVSTKSDFSLTRLMVMTEILFNKFTKKRA
jgi:hypothetical protein